jgi:hypothetical protein
VNCNGQDIMKKGGSKARNRILTVFPFQLGLPAKFADCVLGSLSKLNSETPEFLVDTENVSSTFLNDKKSSSIFRFYSKNTHFYIC